MSGKLFGKCVVVTGAAQGIGMECARAYHREGARVAILDVSLEQGEQAAAAIGPETIFVHCDVASAASVEAARSAVLAVFGRVDALHNNAGIATPSKPLHETDEEEWDKLFQVNLKSVLWTTKHFYKDLKATKGPILNTASMVGLIGQPNHAAYVATKGALISLTKAMALDYATDGIRVNAICPAGVWTPMLRRWAAEQENEADITSYLDRIHPLGNCPEGDVIADAAAFLLSDSARFITGCILPVSGGAELGYRL
ncbi:glucose 1-dehydrogenase [Terriglobus albidus]|uniref:Glucose 1-dehydrogenase n=1 Tax=Terriglobus albidus TaxID=1592106 RepID=A0A5B9EF33_9BACT|nr:glucose 1-dehydrogenase [Terriglobus albidus]QEE28927.1 glucose 1-dehydrogenase [Terriglobus albidus]